MNNGPYIGSLLKRMFENEIWDNYNIFGDVTQSRERFSYVRV